MSNHLQTKVSDHSSISLRANKAANPGRGSVDRPGESSKESTLRDSAHGADLVLLAIADSTERRHLAKTLANSGCEVLVTADSRAALQLAISEQPGLIVLDTASPGSDGFEVCAELKLEQRTRHVPIILFSATLAPEEKMRGLRLGAVDCITKPCDWAEVAAQVCSQLDLARVRNELALANVDLMAVQAQHQAELKAAASVQKSLLPRQTTETYSNLSISWRFSPLDHVGGDLLGYSWLDEDHLAAYVVDVCGHGLPAAMMTAAISISLAPSIDAGDGLQVKQRTAYSPKEMLEKLDREYPIERFDRPFTISYFVLNRKTGEFRCSRAGHPMPIIVRREGQIESIEAGGTMIGLDQMLPFDEGAGKLSHGDSILLYSDGVTECRNESETYGLDRLSSVLHRSSGCSAEVLCDEIVVDLARFNSGAVMQDDVTILALTYEAGLE